MSGEERGAVDTRCQGICGPLCGIYTNRSCGIYLKIPFPAAVNGLELRSYSAVRFPPLNIRRYAFRDTLRSLPHYRAPSKLYLSHCCSRSELDALWQDVLLFQFHDVLPGSCIKRVYDTTAQRYGRAAYGNCDSTRWSGTWLAYGTRSPVWLPCQRLPTLCSITCTHT